MNLRCQKCLLPLLLLRRLTMVDPHNQQSLLGAQYINDLRGNANRSRLVLLPHRLLHNWLLLRLNQKRPHGLNGDVRDPGAAWILYSRDVAGAHSRSPGVTYTSSGNTDHAASPRGRTSPHGTFRCVKCVVQVGVDLTRMSTIGPPSPPLK